MRIKTVFCILALAMMLCACDKPTQGIVIAPPSTKPSVNPGTGDSGNSGNTGNTGDTGNTGNTGDTGNTGSTDNTENTHCTDIGQTPILHPPIRLRLRPPFLKNTIFILVDVTISWRPRFYNRQ